jgi:hypothetical protein
MKKIFYLCVMFIAVFTSAVAFADPSLRYFQLMQDSNNYRGTLTPPPGTYVTCAVLAAGVAETVTIPTGARCVIFSSNADFYVNWTTTAAVPVADITDGSAPELNPSSRQTAGVTSFSIISPTTCIVTMSWFK